ncbi:aminotransferase class V-fold PLP-dependent enzyme [Picosynechococcus sp. PCC 8807]|uniref:aminotransferase class V-fold PLP-dependent enzyme n=1 Tax=Picosynechococcus sp. PCC 8807 TaxID=195248 RepID=UPI0008109FAC|nr:aminotransferase class V-fold PLP-dependent enzyme [Picosynechococcus sp. PCC 8807]ANV91269.1 cysteine lyase [Picosynechococcus sp. PCC 8807]
MPDLHQHRQQFPALAHKTYFNYGGQGPLPQSSLNGILDSYHQGDRQGPFSLAQGQWETGIIQKLRGAIAAELQAQPQNIALTENVTAGCNIALWGIDWQPGDEILLGDCEHPGIVGIVQEIAARFDVKIRICPLFDTLNGGDPTAAIAQHLTPQTRLLVISHLFWNTGQILPLKEICTLCHSQNILVLVDAAQSFGMLPLDLPALGVDFYAFTGHKWWCGPAGVGGLYISTEAIAQHRPTFIGWRGVTQWEKTTEVALAQDARRYEVATSAYPLYVGLMEAIHFHQQWGDTASRYQQICDRSAYCWEKLNAIPQVQCLKTTPPTSGLVSFQVDTAQSHSDIVKALEAQGFCLRTIRFPDCIRACTHYFTTPADIDQLAIALTTLT